MMSRFRTPPSQPGQPERCSSVGRAPPQCFIKTLLPRPDILANAKGTTSHQTGITRGFNSPLAKTPRRKTISAEMGAGPQNVSFPLSPDPNIPANAGGTTLVAGSSPAPEVTSPGSSVGRAVYMFRPTLLPDPNNSPSECLGGTTLRMSRSWVRIPLPLP